MERQYISSIKNEFKKRGLLWFPFFVLIILVLGFEILPGLYILTTSLKGAKALTIENYIIAFTHKYYLMSLKNSILISLSSAIIGIFVGTIAALSLKSVSENWSEKLITAINMTTNFSGVPLAFAYIILLGTSGIFTIFMKTIFHIDIYHQGFNLFSWSGITMVYVYFQIPLSILLMYPAVDQIKDDIKEAAMTLGANTFTFWWKIGIPTLLPSIIGSFCILFANALGAYATAYALVNANKGLLSITIANLVSGDITSDPALASALATIMGGILMVMLFANNKLLKRTKQI